MQFNQIFYDLIKKNFLNNQMYEAIYKIINNWLISTLNNINR